MESDFCAGDLCREINAGFIGANVQKDRLTLNFKDEYYGFVYSINYRIFPDCDIVEKSITVKNESENDIEFERLFSAEFSLPSKQAYTFSNTNGAWGGEFIETNDTLTAGSLVFDSKKGAAWQIARPSVEVDGIAFGTMIVWGTGAGSVF